MLKEIVNHTPMSTELLEEKVVNCIIESVNQKREQWEVEEFLGSVEGFNTTTFEEFSFAIDEGGELRELIIEVIDKELEQKARTAVLKVVGLLD